MTGKDSYDHQRGHFVDAKKKKNVKLKLFFFFYDDRFVLWAVKSNKAIIKNKQPFSTFILSSWCVITLFDKLIKVWITLEKNTFSV